MSALTRMETGLPQTSCSPSGCLTCIKQKAKAFKREALAVQYALADERTPTIAKVIAAATIFYAASPIDLIPDFIPVLGQLDDLLIVPAE